MPDLAANAPCIHTDTYQELKESSAHDVLLRARGTVHCLIATLRHLDEEQQRHQGQQQQNGPYGNMVHVHTL
jgi:hypothetical protein